MRILKAASSLVVLLTAVVCAQAQTVQTTISYPTGVNGVAVDYVATRVYVLLPNYNGTASNAVQVLDGEDGAVVATYAVPVANAIAVNVVTGVVYVAGSVPSTTNASGTESEVVALNPKTGAITATIPVSPNGGGGLVALAVDPVKDRVFASDASDNAIAVINGCSKTFIGLVSLNGQTPAGIAVNLITGKVYAALDSTDSLGNPIGAVAILTEKTSAVSYATYGTAPAGIAVDPVLNREYVTDANFPGAVGALNSKGAALATVPVGNFPQGIDVDFVTSNIFEADSADGTVTKINGLTNTVISTVAPGDAQFIAVDPVETKVWVGGTASVTMLSEF
jgi:DNA-binding beta-propeller fold protein YncE